MKLLGRDTLERRLFGWLLLLTLAPALVVLLVAVWLWSGALVWIGTLGPWDQVALSGQALFEAVDSLASVDVAVAEAVARHREDLSGSVVLARRWAYLGNRLAAQLPFLVIGLCAALSVAALLVSRRLARGLARPIGELVEWAERLGREEALPEPVAREARDPVEVRTLRSALRAASRELAAGRRRALDAERVRVWGEMARRVAHEMKNPLTPLRLAVHRLRAAGAGGGEEALAVIEEETGRLDELAARFGMLGRPPTGPRSGVDVAELLSGLLASDVPSGIEAALEAGPELPLVEGHYEALVRLFRNLLRNAVEAVESGAGVRRITVVAVAVDAGGGAAGPSWLEVRIADTGPGLPQGLGDRIFEPDCTTKSGGTGLGLALVRQVVVAHGGEVTARDVPRGGAEFTVRLPAAAAPQPAVG